MKTMFVISFLLLSLFARAQSDRDRAQWEKDSLSVFGPTPKGTPDGQLAKKMIGTDGGSLISADNKVELIIPPGALSKETEISIQPCTNPFKAGLGRSYDFEPSGIQFKQPVELIFHYTDKDILRNSPQLLTISTQNEKGIWGRLRKVELDTLQKTVKGQMNHFSLWILSYAFYMRSIRDRLKVGDYTAIFAKPIPVSDQPPSPQDAIDVMNDIYGPNLSNPRIWSANGVPNGDGVNGKLTEGIWFMCDYNAPAKVPEANPVEVKLEIRGATGLNFPNNTLTRSIQIEIFDDEYEVHMITTMKSGSIASWGGVITYKDEGSFVVSLDGNTPRLKNIQNQLESINTNCQHTILNPTTRIGIFHVIGAKSIKVNPADPTHPTSREIDIEFYPHRCEFSMIKFNCPPPPGYIHGSSVADNTVMAMMMSNMIPGMPVRLKFLASDNEQVIEEKGQPGGELYIKIWVKKLTD
jgi:hypothetical protein